MTDHQLRRAWLLKVIGLDIPDDADRADDTTAEGARPTPDPLAIWSDAKDAADKGLEKLVQAIRDHPSPVFDSVRSHGLFGLTQGQTVALMRTLHDYGAAPPDGREAAAAALVTTARSYRSFLSGHPAVALIDDNAFGIDVGLNARLSGALTQIEQAVA